MARSKETKIELTAYDDLFETDQSREEARLSKIRDIPISEIDEFPDHPFKVFIDEDMEQLVDSIKRNGVMTPATVRLKEDGRYELISGHRRKKACELAGLETLKCEVKDLSRDEAIIVMVESNLQRSTILPSEKAFAYKMRLEAMNRQGQRSDLTSTPMVSKSRSNEELADKVGESREQIRRYIRLTELVPEILQMVDDRQIAFRPAVEISYLPEEQQYTLLEAMEYSDATPSLAQAIKMKKFMQDDTLTDEVIQSIMEEEKPNQREKPAFRDERITKLIPKSVPRGQESDFVEKWTAPTGCANGRRVPHESWHGRICKEPSSSLYHACRLGRGASHGVSARLVCRHRSQGTSHKEGGQQHSCHGYVSMHVRSDVWYLGLGRTSRSVWLPSFHAPDRSVRLSD